MYNNKMIMYLRTNVDRRDIRSFFFMNWFQCVIRIQSEDTIVTTTFALYINARNESWKWVNQSRLHNVVQWYSSSLKGNRQIQ